MIRTHKRMRRTATKLALSAIAFASLGVAVVAAPTVNGQARLIAVDTPAVRALTSGPALQLAKAGTGASEDCVRVTRMVGPDGKEYPTNGMVCGGE